MQWVTNTSQYIRLRCRLVSSSMFVQLQTFPYFSPNEWPLQRTAAQLSFSVCRLSLLAEQRHNSTHQPGLREAEWLGGRETEMSKSLQSSRISSYVSAPQW